MKADVFNAQAALLYEAAPRIDFDGFMQFFSELAHENGLRDGFVVLQGACSDTVFCFSGCGVRVTISIQDSPLAADAFALPLRSPILKHKNFDFDAAILRHGAAIVVTVHDGEVSLPVEADRMLADVATPPAAAAEARLTALHLTLRGLATLQMPLMIDFCPSQLLLTPVEMAALDLVGLPYPILFHPFPVSNGKAADGTPRRGMAAIHAAKLIGAELELEAVPAEVPLAQRIDMLAALIEYKRDGTLPLDHGDELESDDGNTQWVRHEPGSTEDGPPRIIVSFDTPAPNPAAADQPEGAAAFQDRIGRLRSRAENQPAVNDMAYSMDDMTHSMDTSSVAGAPADSETDEELRARIQDTITPAPTARGVFGLMAGPAKLMIAMGLLGLFFLFAPTNDLTDMVSSETVSIDEMMQTLERPQISATGPTTTATTGMVGSIGQSFKNTLRP